ncbi:MAG: hypothetical protein Q7S44_00510, partial [bacterium]|nr:hypothetical protein [bacterium]
MLTATEREDTPEGKIAQAKNLFTQAALKNCRTSGEIREFLAKFDLGQAIFPEHERAEHHAVMWGIVFARTYMGKPAPDLRSEDLKSRTVSPATTPAVAKAPVELGPDVTVEIQNPGRLFTQLVYQAERDLNPRLKKGIFIEGRLLAPFTTSETLAQTAGARGSGMFFRLESSLYYQKVREEDSLEGHPQLYSPKGVDRVFGELDSPKFFKVERAVNPDGLSEIMVDTELQVVKVVLGATSAESYEALRDKSIKERGEGQINNLGEVGRNRVFIQSEVRNYTAGQKEVWGHLLEAKSFPKLIKDFGEVYGSVVA